MAAHGKDVFDIVVDALISIAMAVSGVKRMSRALTGVLFCSVVVAGGCDGVSPQTGGGPIVYAASQIEVVARRPTGATLVAFIPGLQAVERIESETGTAETIRPPQGVGACFPICLSVGDLDGDGEKEVAIIDPTCGNWIARLRPDGSNEAVAWSPSPR